MTREDVNKITNKFLILNDDFYVNAKHHHNWKCLCGNDFVRTWDNIKSKSSYLCRTCSRKNKKASKYDISFVRKYVENNSTCKLISTEYDNCHDYLHLKCDCGNEFKKTFSRFMNSKHNSCVECHNKWKSGNSYNKLTYEFVKNFIETNSLCKLLSKDYINSNEKIKILCPCGNIYNVSFAAFRKENQRQCKHCGYKNGAIKQRKDKDTFINEFYKFLGSDYELLSQYVNSKTNVKVKHLKCGSIYDQLPSKILSGHRCPRCYGCYKKTFQEVKKELDGILNDMFEVVEYKDCNNVKLKCKCGNILTRNLSSIKKQQGCKCDKCKSSRGSRNIETYLKNRNISYIKEFKFERCVLQKKLPFDFYLPNHNICIEFDGEQHSRILKHWGGLDGFITRVIRDTIKNVYCENNNIKLIRIPYYIVDDIDDVLDKNIILK